MINLSLILRVGPKYLQSDQPLPEIFILLPLYRVISDVIGNFLAGFLIADDVFVIIAFSDIKHPI